MFKDYGKYLSTSLKVYLFVLVAIFIMKLVGLDYFGIDINNSTFVNISDFAIKYNLKDVWYAITMLFYLYMFISISCKDNSKRMKLFILITSPLTFLLKYASNIISLTAITYFIEMFYMLFICYIYNKLYLKNKFKIVLKRFIFFIILNTIFQLISGITRVRYISKTDYNFITNIILDFDYIILLLIFYKIYFMKGEYLCSETEVGLSLLKKMNLKKLLKELQNSLRKFKKQDKESKLTIIIYLLLSLIWNIATLVIVLLVAMLNHTLIECIFILTSFWITKRTFGKAFHLKSMVQCFIVSNLTYYVLNRITTPLGISIFVPILLGVGLSYFTSKLVKKTYKPLYKGISKEVFEETILKVVEKDSLKYKICYDFYIEGKSDLSLSFKYNYSLAGIRKIKSRVNDSIKGLN